MQGSVEKGAATRNGRKRDGVVASQAQLTTDRSSLRTSSPMDSSRPYRAATFSHSVTQKMLPASWMLRQLIQRVENGDYPISSALYGGMAQSGRHTPIKNRLSGHLRACRGASAVARRPTVVVSEAAAGSSLMW